MMQNGFNGFAEIYLIYLFYIVKTMYNGYFKSTWKRYLSLVYLILDSTY
jgi:hypothetical protein